MFDSFQLWALPGSYKPMKSSVSGIESVSEVNSEGASTSSNALSMDSDGNMEMNTVTVSASKAVNTGGIVGASAGTDDFSVPDIKEAFLSMNFSNWF